MRNPLTTSPDAEHQQVKRIEGLVTVSEYLSKASAALKDVDLVEATGKALPWASLIGEAASEAIPVVKFVAKLFRAATRITDPQRLGCIACTTAYQQAIQEAVKKIGGPAKPKRGGLLGDDHLEDVDFLTLDLDAPADHPFFRRARGALDQWAGSVGYEDAEKTKLLAEVQSRVGGNLKQLLSHEKTAKRFASYRQLVELDLADRRAHHALQIHAEYQRTLFDETPVLGKEPFALQHVYTELDCGRRKWKELHDCDSARQHGERGKIDPFFEPRDLRKPLLDAVLELIADPNHEDAIVIQGVAGSGKSTFTKKLVATLLDKGLRPIRVELGDVPLSDGVNFYEALRRAIHLTGKDRIDDPAAPQKPDDMLLDGGVFKLRVPHSDDLQICPYVLILDGWDEISLSNEGFQERVRRLLRNVREEILQQHNGRVRVILTGRPSAQVDQCSLFFHPATPILTVQQLTPEQLNAFVEGMRGALKAHPVPVPDADEWEIPAKVSEAQEKYAKDFEEKEEAPDKDMGSMEVLGLPLLAHLALRVMAQWPEECDALVSQPTTLYRRLVDLTVDAAGKVKGAETHDQLRFAGDPLRRLLQDTAAAMTALGAEFITGAELESRVALDDAGIATQARTAEEDSPFTKLMVSYYFKSGDLSRGCEFMHKSFREYLFAERIIRALREFGEECKGEVPTRGEEYWKDFAPDHVLYGLSRRLTELLGPQWLSKEVIDHLQSLLKWEIERSGEEGDGGEVPPLTTEEWEHIRDALAELWDWWGEGAHLRPQVFQGKPNRDYSLAPPYVLQVIGHCLPQAERNRARPQPWRTTTIDGHLGDGLFRLCGWAHAFLAERQGLTINKVREAAQTAEKGRLYTDDHPRPYQTTARWKGKTWTLFRPSGESGSYLKNYIARIAAAGGKQAAQGERFWFAPYVDLRDTSLAFESLYGAFLCGASLEGAELFGAGLSEASLDGADLRYTELGYTFCIFASLKCATLTGADCGNARLGDAIFNGARIWDAHMSEADLTFADLRDADLRGANLSGAILREARFTEAIIRGADFTGADTEGAIDLDIQGSGGVIRDE